METIDSAAQGLESSVKRVLDTFDDASREGLKRTPHRYVKFLQEFLTPEPFEFTTFDAEGYDQMIVQAEIPFYSLCEHHLAPFFGTGAIAYIPNGKIVGLSKLARVLDMHARRFQNQERITSDVAHYIQKKLDPLGVAVILRAQHLCMGMRGIKKPNTYTTTSKMLGLFRTDAAVRMELLELIKVK